MSVSEDSALSRKTCVVPIVRVLYTLNASPRFLLARQRRKVTVELIVEDEGNGPASTSELKGTASAKQRYAKVSLKTCLGAVCNFSPELLADSARDYSVYVLDPLESSSNDGNSSHVFESLPPDAQVSSSSSSLPPCPGGDGISVGMGLLSWCLSGDRNNARRTGEDNEEGYVFGKLVKDRGADALEVVMSLRETASQTQRQHALSLSSWGFPAGSTTSPLAEYTPPGTIQLPSSVGTAPCPLPPHASRICPQSSTASSNFLKDRLLELVETSMSQSTSPSGPHLMSSVSQPAMPSSTTPATGSKRVGRPPGTRMHPEKRARRIAIESHREKLEKLENIAKGQRGQAYDKTLVVSSELEGPQVTDEDIARQQKTLQDLESRPLIVDQSSCLTTEPLPKRAVSPASIVPLSKQVDNVAPKRKGRSNTPTNAAASGSNQYAATAVAQLPGGSTHGVTGDQQGAGLLLSLLACVLGNVDGPSIAGMTPVADARQNDGKGKTKKTSPPVDNALTGALQRLLPLLSTNVSRSAASPSTSASSLVQHPSDSGTCTPDANQSKPLQPQKGQRLFKTTEETFYSDLPHGPNWPRDNHWVAGKSMPSEEPTPKVREEAYPVPGGGWARGRCLVPRDSTPRAPDISRDVTMHTNTLTTPVASEKENKSHTKTKRGLKRSLSNGVDAKENAATSNAARRQSSTKKRKQENTSGVNSNAVKSQGTTRVVMGSAQNNRAHLSQKSGSMFTASSPGRATAPISVDRSLPVMAMSEPDYFSPGLPARPVVSPKNSSSELPKTPPRCDRLSDDDAGGSLFTPCAPTSAAQLVGNAMPPADGLLFSPSPVSAISRGNHAEAGSRLPATVGHSENQSNGWDLPPSSPPPPTSPMSPPTDLGAEQGMDFEFVSQLLNELNNEMEQADARFEDHGTTINGASASTVAGGPPPSLAEGPPSDEPLAFQTPATSSDFDPLSDGTFDFGELGQIEGEQAGGQGIELDINELWSSLGPVIVQAQAESNMDGNALQPSPPREDFGIFGLGSDQTHVESQVQGGVDAVKLAEDLKALFGGCVV